MLHLHEMIRYTTLFFIYLTIYEPQNAEDKRIFNLFANYEKVLCKDGGSAYIDGIDTLDVLINIELES